MPGCIEPLGRVSEPATLDRAWIERGLAGIVPFPRDAQLLYDHAPYGVGSFVGVWTRR